MSDQKPAKVLFRTAAKPHEKITTLPSTHTLSHAPDFREHQPVSRLAHRITVPVTVPARFAAAVVFSAFTPHAFFIQCLRTSCFFNASTHPVSKSFPFSLSEKRTAKFSGVKTVPS